MKGNAMLVRLRNLLNALANEPGWTEKIVRWQEVRPGDMVLLDDALIRADEVDLVQKPWGNGATFTAVDIGYQRDNGTRGSAEQHGDRYTAVRRPNFAPARKAADWRPQQ